MTASRHPRRTNIWSAIAALAVLIAVAAIWNGSDSSPPAESAASLSMSDPTEVYDPVTAGEDLPFAYRPLLDRDQIAPVYNPVFTSADAVDWPRDSLVIGVAGDGAAKAYPVTHLNSREMVIDSIAGIPILVTW